MLHMKSSVVVKRKQHVLSLQVTDVETSVDFSKYKRAKRACERSNKMDENLVAARALSVRDAW